MNPDYLLHHLAAQALQVPELHSALENVVLEGTTPRVQAYITRPGLLSDPFQQHYKVGIKVTYFDKEGIQQQLGHLARLTTIQNQALLEHTIYVLALGLADGILAYEAARKPLPVKEFTAKDREEMCLPF